MARKRKTTPTPAISIPMQLGLIVALILTVVPHLSRLPAWVVLFIVVTLGLKLASLRYPKIAPPKIVITVIAMLMFVAVGLYYSTLFGRDAGVSMLVGMLFLKLFETRSFRDAMVMLSLNYFVIITNFLYTQSIPTAIYMLFVVAHITFTLITLNAGPARIDWREKLRLSFALTLLALPLMLLLFILFPRIPGPLWGLPNDVYAATTGLSDTMSPGEVSQLARSYAVAFRVTFDGPVPRQQDLYWRAIVMQDFDGRNWLAEKKWLGKPKPEISYQGPAVEYTVTLEPHQQRWLFTLDLVDPDQVGKLSGEYDGIFTRGGQLVTPIPVINLIQYRATSYPSYRFGKRLGAAERQQLLQLPKDYNPRTQELAQRWRRENADPRQIIQQALLLFNQQFTYTLRPPPLGKHTADDFLFNTQRGFCEHFASAFVVLMRAASIPARVVAGYQGGEVNPLGEYLLVRQSDAHAWTEVWLDNLGWIRIDPTSAVSPERIEQSLDQAIPANENPRWLIRSDFKLLEQLRLVWDSVNYRWDKWILGYGPEMQQLFLSYLGFQNTTVYNLLLALVFALSLCIAIIAFISLRNARSEHTDKVQTLYLKLCGKLSKAGYPRRPYQGPWQFFEQIEQLDTELANRLKPVIQMYIALRYRPNHPAANYNRFLQMVRNFNFKKNAGMVTTKP